MNSIRKKITNSIYSDYNKLKNNFCIKYFVNKNTVQAIVSFFHLYFIHTAFLICMIETGIKILKMSTNKNIEDVKNTAANHCSSSPDTGRVLSMC